MQVYVCQQVQDVVDLYGGLLGESAWSRSVGEQLRILAERLATGHRARHPGAHVELSNWHPALVSESADFIWSAALAEPDYLLTVARGHGYSDWTAAEAAADTRPSVAFERSVDAVLDGDLGALRAELTRDPGLIAQRSHWGHRSALLHYIAANGVEDYRQRVPHNAPEIVRCLLDHGAEARAYADMYGGGQTVLGLLLTGQHPKEAGLTVELAELLRKVGA